MKIKYELTPEDFYRFSKENAPSQFTHKPMVALYALTYLVFIFADIIYALIFGMPSDWSIGAILMSILIRTVICSLALFVVLGLIKLFVNKKSKELTSKPNNGAFCEHQIIINERELIELTNVNTSRYSWKTIGEIKEMENFVVIEILLSSSYIIPKRFFQNKQEIKNFIQTANSYKQDAELRFAPSHIIDYEKRLELE